MMKGHTAENDIDGSIVERKRLGRCELEDGLWIQSGSLRDHSLGGIDTE